MEEENTREAQESMNEIVSHLKPLSKNTVYTQQLLGKVIDDEVYEKVKVKDEFPYQQLEGVEEFEKKIETDKDFKKEYLKGISLELGNKGFRELEAYDVDIESKNVLVEYVASYLGRREYPEMHLKTLLVSGEVDGKDIYNKKTFDEVVEKAKSDLKTEKQKERTDYFASLFWEAFLESNSLTVG